MSKGANKMKIPKTIKIGGFNYQVILKDRYKEDGSTDLGTHSVHQLKIWIDREMVQQQQEETLLHEIIEAINDHNDLKLEHNQISGISNNIYQVLKDNQLIK